MSWDNLPPNVRESDIEPPAEVNVPDWFISNWLEENDANVHSREVLESNQHLLEILEEDYLTYRQSILES